MAFYRCGSGAMSKIYYLTDISVIMTNVGAAANTKPISKTFDAQAFGIKNWGKLTEDNFVLGLTLVNFCFNHVNGWNDHKEITVQKRYDQTTGVLTITVPYPSSSQYLHLGYAGPLYLITRPIPNYKDD